MSNYEKYKFTDQTAFNSYKNFKAKVDEGVKEGLLSREQAFKCLKSAKKNYSNLSLNKSIDRNEV
jgi:hypothetical protein